MRISVIGTGYLGAVHAACMAKLGHDVVAFDTDASKIDLLAAGKTPFYEPDFDDLLIEVLAAGRLRFTSSVADAVAGARVHFVCVGTPQQMGSDAANVSFVDSAFRSVAAHADCDGLIVGKSTVPVGTAQRLANELATDATEYHLELAWNPEFLREGKAVEDTLAPDRLVFGVSSESAEKTLHEVYEALLNAGTPHLTADLATAELVKVAANAFLATKISFINAMAEVCEVVDADVVTLSRALGYDDRIGKRFLNAGLGFGGGCLPKDIRAFSARAGELGASDALRFLHEVDKINLRRREKAVSVAQALVGGEFLGASVTVLGAAFKPNSDDVRDSPALNVAASMHLKGADVRVHDPKALTNAKARFPTLSYFDSATDASRNADLIVLATEWDEYTAMDPAAFRSVVRQPRLLDTRNVIDRQLWTSAGWQVHGLGRPGSSADPVRHSS
ncbi:UDP-glucose 6-dehydrogenase [Mycobacteroides abscessus subsp. abscessus]|nr:UDP-glucose 6-dehydrogenase [Mycobacteroides abscessus subsp. abscessus]